MTYARIGFGVATRGSVRLWKCLSFLCALMLSGTMTQAAFSLNFTVQYGAPTVGYNRYQFYAINDGTNGTGTTILSEDIELICDKPMVIGLDSMGNADYMGLSAADPYNSDRSFVNIYSDPGTIGGPGTGGFQGFPVGVSASTWIGGTTDMEVAMFHDAQNIKGLNYGPDATSATNDGLGALIATMIVPSDASLVELIPWGLAGERGPAYGYFLGATNPDSLHPFDPTKQYVMSALAPVPEPSALATAALCLLALVRRRSRSN